MPFSYGERESRFGFVGYFIYHAGLKKDMIGKRDCDVIRLQRLKLQHYVSSGRKEYIDKIVSDSGG